MEFIIIFISVGAGALAGFVAARKWFMDNYSQKLKNFSDKLADLQNQTIVAMNRYAEKEKELEEKYKNSTTK